MAPSTKSILKNVVVQDATGNSQTKKTNDKARAIATQHAEIIQQRKEVEAELFKAMLILIDMPRHNDADPARPTEMDMAEMRRNLKLFQKSDFKELIEERKANERCGYVLCPRPCRRIPTTAQYRVLSKLEGGKTQPHERLKAWCSKECAERAMFIEAQIPLEPAWLRPENEEHLTIDPLLENQPQRVLPLRPKRVEDSDGQEHLSDGLRRVMLKQEGSKEPSGKSSLMNDRVVEKHKVLPAPEPNLESELHHEGLS